MIGRVSAGPRKRQDRHPVDSRTPVIGRVSAGAIAMQKPLLQYLIETFLQYNYVANQRKKQKKARDRQSQRRSHSYAEDVTSVH